MSERLRTGKAFSPADMGALLVRKGLATGVTTSKTPEITTPKAKAPYEGKLVEINGQGYQYTAAVVHVRNHGTGQYEPKQLTLRTWFSHSTPQEGIAMGPGWDSRFGLSRLTPDQQMERYGHLFSPEEISDPRTMPDVPYYELQPVEDDR